MRKVFRRVFAALMIAAASAVWAAEKVYYPGVEILCETNKSALSYQPGEEMVFKFRLSSTKGLPEKSFLRYTRRGDDGKSFEGEVPATETLTVKTSLDKPGFVSVDVFLNNEKSEILWNSDNRRNGKIVFYGGAAVHPEKLTDCGEPADFDAFWERQKKRLAAVPFQGKTECKLVKTVKNGKIYEVSIPCAGPRPATGYLMVPDNAKAKSLPIRIEFFGYGAVKQSVPQSIIPGHLLFRLNAHGQKLGQSDEYYKDFFNSIRSGENKRYSYAFDPELNKDPENCFFNGMVLRILRAMEYLKSRPEWNGKTLIAAGGSQGGLQTMWAAALDPDVTLAAPSITWCCDLAGSDKAGRIHGRWRIKYVPALDYYDPVFMAKRIKNAEVRITRAGMGDYVCPPSGLAISYNNLATPKKNIRWVQGSDHGFVPNNSEVVVWSTMKTEK